MVRSVCGGGGEEFGIKRRRMRMRMYMAAQKVEAQTEIRRKRRWVGVPGWW